MTPTTGTSGAGSSPGTPPPGSITIPGQAPDYASQIENDPAYVNLKNSLSAQGIGDAAHLRAAIQQALIQFGKVPDLSNEVSSAAGIDRAGTQALADQNPFSTLKRLQQAYQDQQMSAKNQLAARGILSSGETGYQLGKIGQNEANSEYDATNSLLGNIGGFYDQYAAGQKAAAQQLAQGAFTAEGNAAANNVSSAATSATYDPTSGLYKDANGNYYKPDGSPTSYSAPAPSAPVAPTPAPAPVASPNPDSGIPYGTTSNATGILGRNTFV